MGHACNTRATATRDDYFYHLCKQQGLKRQHHEVAWDFQSLLRRRDEVVLTQRGFDASMIFME
jgi:hypothetical protein